VPCLLGSVAHANVAAAIELASASADAHGLLIETFSGRRKTEASPDAIVGTLPDVLRPAVTAC
jgi:hypothetical protein